MSISYRNRILIAGALALVLNVALFVVVPRLERKHVLAVPASEPLVLRLNPPEEPRPPARLIEAGAPADAPSEDTDLISDRNSRAQDMSEAEGERNQPAVDRVLEGDQLSAPAMQPVAAQPPTPQAAPPTEAQEEAPAPEEAAPEPVNPEETIEGSEQAMDDSAIAVTQPREEQAVAREEAVDASEAREEDPLPEPFELAQNPIPAPAPQEDPNISGGRDGGGVDSQGFLSFEANQHELGAYMLSIRRRVERRWRAALSLRYSGAGPSSALLECAISPDGRVASVEVLDPGTSVTYASLCKQAIEQAGPFDPFPFEVPEIYRNKNLVVRWKFSYL